MTARAPSGCRCACSSTTAFGCWRPANHRASARARRNRAMCSDRRNCQRARAERRRRQGARRHRTDARIQGGRRHRLAVGGPAAAQSCSRASAPPRIRSGSARAGIGAARARASIAAARSRSPSSGARSRPIRPHSPMKICAFGSSPAAVSRRCARPCFFLLDVSGSMSERDRQLAKTFFFWVAAGLRREYKALDIVFVAHTTDAWEFSEADFFKVTGSGGTVASAGLAKVREIMQARFNPGEHAMSTCSMHRMATTPRTTARRPRQELESIAKVARYAGYVEISAGRAQHRRARRSHCFRRSPTRACPAAAIRLPGRTMFAAALRHFFTSRVAGGRAARHAAEQVHERRLAQPRTAARGSGAQARTRLVAGDLRSRSR